MSVTKPSGHDISHCTGEHSSTHLPAVPAAWVGLPQSIGWHCTSAHARYDGSDFGTACVGQSQHFAPAVAQSLATAHSPGTAPPLPLPLPWSGFRLSL